MEKAESEALHYIWRVLVSPRALLQAGDFTEGFTPAQKKRFWDAVVRVRKDIHERWAQAEERLA